MPSIDKALRREQSKSRRTTKKLPYNAYDSYIGKRKKDEIKRSKRKRERGKEGY